MKPKKDWSKLEAAFAEIEKNPEKHFKAAPSSADRETFPNPLKAPQWGNYLDREQWRLKFDNWKYR